MSPRATFIAHSKSRTCTEELPSADPSGVHNSSGKRHRGLRPNTRTSIQYRSHRVRERRSLMRGFRNGTSTTFGPNQRWFITSIQWRPKARTVWARGAARSGVDRATWSKRRGPNSVSVDSRCNSLLARIPGIPSLRTNVARRGPTRRTAGLVGLPPALTRPKPNRASTTRRIVRLPSGTQSDGALGFKLGPVPVPASNAVYLRNEGVGRAC